MLTIHKASAGSGKTYQLALNYIRTLLGVPQEGADRWCLNLPELAPGGYRRPDRHSHILAITFTNKATGEMKERIISELDALRHIPPAGEKDASKYAGTLMKDFGCTRSQLAQAADLALTELLLGFSSFNVSTIDSFFQRVLRTFAREVERQGDYGVELDDNYAAAVGVDMMFKDLNLTPADKKDAARHGKIIRWIENFSLEQLRKGKSFNLFNSRSSITEALRKAVATAMNEQYKKHAPAMTEYLEADNGTLPGRYVLALRQYAQRLTDSLAPRVREILQSLDAEGYTPAVFPSSLGKNLDAIAAGKYEIPSKTPKYIMSFLNPSEASEMDMVTKKELRKLPGSKELDYPTHSVQLMSSLLQDYVKMRNTLRSLETLVKSTGNLEFLGFVFHYIHRFRKENNLILLSDTNELLGSIISESDTPFIYERLGVILEHFMIDEFQDTSELQWRNLRPLLSNSLSQQRSNLIIGDVKQAIYRFRNSDSSMLHSTVAQEDFPGQTIELGQAPGENTNYRSAHRVVRFNNTLFSRLAAMLDVKGYEGIIQTLPPSTADIKGYVSVKETEDEQSSFKALAAAILDAHSRGVAWKDMAILVRRRKEANAIVSAFQDEYPQIPILSDESLLLQSATSVQLIVSILRLLDQSHIKSNRKTNSEKRYATRGQVVLMQCRYGYYVTQGMSPEQALKKALDGIDRPDEAIDKMLDSVRCNGLNGISATVEAIIDKVMSPKLLKDEIAYVAAFQDLVTSFCSLYPATLHSFLKYWDRVRGHQALSTAPSLDAVNIMTIHKSKGLEWDCVFMPYAGFSMGFGLMSAWVEPPQIDGIPAELVPPLLHVPLDRSSLGDEGSLLKEAYLHERTQTVTDSLNMAYVAFTRARRELHVWLTSSSVSEQYFGKYLIEALEDRTVPAEEFTENLSAGAVESTDGLRHFIYGELTTVEHREAATEAEPAPEYFINLDHPARQRVAGNDWFSEHADADITPDETLSRTDAVVDMRTRQAAERGQHLHAILGEMDVLEDLDHAIDRIARTYSLSPELAAEYHSVLTDAFEKAGDAVHRWFMPEGTVLKEQSIFIPGMPDDTVLRPDRVILTDNGSAVIVDYKFTSAPQARHKAQVKAYADALRAMGYNDIDVYLWYPDLRLVENIRNL
ncbi:MAG: UvrD-helicase domain-containing protein [Muribaculaceae bacterium]|nr:UvrD-helicase domain-containing protein [Muribaculaceae bacterium]